MSRDIVYEKLIRPILFSLDPELVHHIAQTALAASGLTLPLLGLHYGKTDLETNLFGRRISNPIGLAAGFDKNAALVSLLSLLGFGYAEIGSVCARPHGGNNRPRLFRLPEDSALINRLGLNGLGVEVVASNLEKFKEMPLPLGINIAKTNDAKISGADAVEDIVYSFQRVKDLPLDYVTINTSCPNTEEGCLKESDMLARVLDKICALNTKNLPLLLKLSPDSSDSFITELLSISASSGVSGFVCGNTTLNRDSLKTKAETVSAIGAGGLSGKPLKPLNLALTRKVAALKSDKQVIIGVGGIESGQDAFDYLSAGAQLIQIYTGFVYRGPFAVKGICEELSQILKEKGLTLRELCSKPVAI